MNNISETIIENLAELHVLKMPISPQRDKCFFSFVEGCRTYRDLLEQQKKIALSQNGVSDKWIDVKDNLPEKGIPVLIATKHWVGVGYYDKNFELELEDEPIWSEENGEYIFEGSVTHWKELDKNPNNQ